MGFAFRAVSHRHAGCRLWYEPSRRRFWSGQIRGRPVESSAGPEGPLNLVFSSRVPSECRSALEELLFFNPRQYRVREGIINSLEQFGHPRLEDTASGLAIRVGNQDAQTLFAYDRDRRGEAP